MSGRYAEGTRVPVAQSRAELQRVLERYGATETLIYERLEAGQIRIGFVLHEWKIAIPFSMPHPNDPAYRTAFRERNQAAFEREQRRRWRVLILTLKAKLEAVENDAETTEQAFLPYLMLPDGGTVGDRAIPMVQEARRTDRLPVSLIPGLDAGPAVIALTSGEDQ